MKKYNTNIVATLLTLSLSLLTVSAKANTTHNFHSRANLIGHYNDSATSWLDGGLGRLGVGSGENDLSALGEIQVNYTFELNEQLNLSSHMQFQESSDHNSAQKAGIVELKIRYALALTDDQRISLTAGQFFLPISMENTDRFWESPYSINFSALNSWIGEEFRPIGVDIKYATTLPSGGRWSVAGTAFGGNDSMGAILAWRGWSHGRHRTVYGDTLSLPALSSLETGGAFEDQKDDGSQPFSKDLDGRVGYAIRTSWTDSSSYKINLSWIDNLADTKLHRGEYAWRTQFGIAGATWFVTEDFAIVGETINGNSTMGEGPGVDIDFSATYLLASLNVNEVRYSARAEVFETKDLDLVDTENNDFGRSYTLAIMWAPTNSAISTGAEILYTESSRQRTITSGNYEDDDGASISLLARYTF